MDKSIVKRIEALEARQPTALIVYVVTADGQEAALPFSEIVDDEGNLRPCFHGFGRLDGSQIVKSGDNLMEFDRLLNCLLPAAAVDAPQSNTTQTHR